MEPPNWYCLRSRQKQEHIAAANLRQLGLEVFNPRFRIRRATPRGPVWFNEALFPSYLFARFALHERLREIQRTSGVGLVLEFGGRFPEIPDAVIAELRQLIGHDELLAQPETFSPSQEIRVAAGAFKGLVGVVKQALPAAQRVRILLEILGRDTEVEMDSSLLVNTDVEHWKREAIGYGRA